MQKIQELAFACVARAVMFGTLAISCIMLSFSFNPAMAFRAGAFLTLIMSAVLVFKAMVALGLNPRRTEVWAYLDETTRPQELHAQKIIGGIMRESYIHFAWLTFYAAMGLFTASIVSSLIGFTKLG